MTYKIIESNLMEKANELGFKGIPEIIRFELDNATAIGGDFEYDLTQQLEKLAENADEVTECCEVFPYDDDEFCTECYKKNPTMIKVA